MPKSKRVRTEALTQVKKKGKEGKEFLIEEIRECAEEYKSIIVLDVNNFRTQPMQEIREKFASTSKFFMGKNKVMQVALGRSREDEVAEQIHNVADALKGTRALMFTNDDVDEIMKFFRSFAEPDFPRAGFVATQTVAVPAGTLVQFIHSQEVMLRGLGLPVRLVRGAIVLDADHTVCAEGDTLTQLLGVKMSTFHLVPVCVWSDGKFTEIPQMS